MRVLVALLVVGAGGAASAQSNLDDLWQVRARYGIAFRSGTQGSEPPTTLSYQGLTPNDLSLQGWAWYRYVGATLGIGREGFALFEPDSGARVTQGGLLRGHLAATGRIPLGPLRIEPQVGYALQQLPGFQLDERVRFGAATRHGLLLAARLLLALGPVTLEARGELPIALATTPAPGFRFARSSGFAAGGGVRAQLFATGQLHWGLMLDAAYVSDSLSLVGDDDVAQAASQSVVRAGLSLDVQWRDPKSGPTTGAVLVRLIDADTGAALTASEVVVTVDGREVRAQPESDGVLAARELPPGRFYVRAAADGYQPLKSTGELSAGAEVPLELKLKKVAPLTGAVAISVLDAESKKPLPEVTVRVGEQTQVSDANGVARFAAVAPGPVAVSASAEAYQPAEEAASVLAGKTVELTLALVPAKQRVPATITGIVRSTRGGAPVSAELEVPQVKIKTRADSKGAFLFRVEGGTYTVKVSAPGFRPQTKELTVKDGDQAIFNIDLYPK